MDRSAGPAGSVQRAPETITAKAKLDLMLLVLRSAAARAHYETSELEAGTQARLRPRFTLAVQEISTDLDEALLLSEQKVGGAAVFKAATTLFGAVLPLVKLGDAKKYSGSATVQRKLAALNASLLKQGYKLPLDKIPVAQVAAPKELENPELLRAAAVLLMAARIEMQAGIQQLAADRKAGRTPSQLHGGRVAAIHVRDAHRLLTDLFHTESDQFHKLRVDAIATGDVALGLLREGAALTDARALWDEMNGMNSYLGLAPLMPFGTLTATNRQEASAERLEELDKKRLESAEARKTWTPEETKAQVGAEHEAVAAATAALGKAQSKTGSKPDVSAVMQRVNSDIDRIELARSIGYTDAVTFLATRALDTPSNIKAFAQSLIGNLIWALSSFIPAVGLLKEGNRFVRKIGNVAKADAELGAAVGVIGAMIAQFSAGLPSSGSGDVSGRLDGLKETLKRANSALSNNRRAQSYILMSRLMSEQPPRPNEDSDNYLAALEATLRHSLYGEVFAKNMNDGYRPDESKVEGEAKRQMLAAASAPYADVTAEGKLKPSTPVLDLDYAKKILKAGTESASLTFDRFDLVASRVSIAAREMGCRVTVDPEKLNAALARGETVELPVGYWSWSDMALSQRTGSFTRWEGLVRDKRIQTNPHFAMAFALDGASMKSIDSITVSASDMSRKTFHGKEVFTLDRASFAAVGGGHYSQYMYSGSKSPDTFKVIYSFKEA